MAWEYDYRAERTTIEPSVLIYPDWHTKPDYGDELGTWGDSCTLQRSDFIPGQAMPLERIYIANDQTQWGSIWTEQGEGLNALERKAHGIMRGAHDELGISHAINRAIGRIVVLPTAHVWSNLAKRVNGRQTNWRDGTDQRDIIRVRDGSYFEVKRQRSIRTEFVVLDKTHALLVQDVRFAGYILITGEFDERLIYFIAPDARVFYRDWHRPRQGDTLRAHPHARVQDMEEITRYGVKRIE